MPEKYIISSLWIRRPRLRVIYPRSCSKIDEDQTQMQAFRLQILGSFYKLSLLEDGKGQRSPIRNPGDIVSRAVKFRTDGLPFNLSRMQRGGGKEAVRDPTPCTSASPTPQTLNLHLILLP